MADAAFTARPEDITMQSSLLGPSALAGDWQIDLDKFDSLDMSGAELPPQLLSPTTFTTPMDLTGIPTEVRYLRCCIEYLCSLCV